MFTPQIDSTDIYTTSLSFIGAFYVQLLAFPVVQLNSFELYLLDLFRSLTISIICAIVGFLIGRFLKKKFPPKK